MFDIQKFAEETAETTETQEEMPIPEELKGISEEVAREVLNEQVSREKAQTVEEKPEPTTEPEFDEEGNYTGEGKVEDVKIDYARYKETLDKSKDFEKQLAAYREKYGDINAPQQNQQPPQPQQQQYQQPAMQNYQQQVQQSIPKQKPPEPRYFTAEDARQINDAIMKATMEATGLTEEDVSNLDFLDDDDPKVLAWQGMKRYAEVATIFNIMQAQQLAAQENYRREMLMNQSATDFNSYVNQQQGLAEFNELQQFAGSEFFNAQSPVKKQIILEANSRLENQQATPTDFIIVRDYFTRAKAAYDAKKQVKPATPPAPKKQAPKPQFPRTDKVNGILGSGGGITNASLAEMMRTTDWNKIPQQYKDILLNATT